MLPRVTINIIRRLICNNARAFYCAGNSVQSNVMHDNNTKQHNIQNHYNHYNLYMTKRFKSRKKTADNKKNRDEDSDEENDEDDEEEVPIGSKVLTINVSSPRLDSVCKVGFGMTRNKMEEAFYASKFRINGKKVFKKSMDVKVGDEIDLILHRKENNSTLLIVNRILILSMHPGNNVQIKLSRDKNLLIEDYEESWSTA